MEEKKRRTKIFAVLRGTRGDIIVNGVAKAEAMEELCFDECGQRGWMVSREVCAARVAVPLAFGEMPDEHTFSIEVRGCCPGHCMEKRLGRTVCQPMLIRPVARGALTCPHSLREEPRSGAHLRVGGQEKWSWSEEGDNCFVFGQRTRGIFCLLRRARRWRSVRERTSRKFVALKRRLVKAGTIRWCEHV